MTGLGYLGGDIVLDQKHGPLVLELNARPGLAIQTANGYGVAKTACTALNEADRHDLPPTAEARVDWDHHFTKGAPT